MDINNIINKIKSNISLFLLSFCLIILIILSIVILNNERNYIIGKTPSITFSALAPNLQSAKINTIASVHTNDDKSYISKSFLSENGLLKYVNDNKIVVNFSINEMSQKGVFYITDNTKYSVLLGNNDLNRYMVDINKNIDNMSLYFKPIKIISYELIFYIIFSLGLIYFIINNYFFKDFKFLIFEIKLLLANKQKLISNTNSFFKPIKLIINNLTTELDALKFSEQIKNKKVKTNQLLSQVKIKHINPLKDRGYDSLIKHYNTNQEIGDIFNVIDTGNKFYMYLGTAVGLNHKALLTGNSLRIVLDSIKFYGEHNLYILLQHLNACIYELSDTANYLSLLLFEWTRDNKILNIYGFGNYTAFILRQKTKDVEIVNIDTVSLGIIGNIIPLVNNNSIALNENDSCIVFSNSIFSLKNNNGMCIDINTIKQILLSVVSESDINKLWLHIKLELTDYKFNKNQKQDLTSIIFRNSNRMDDKKVSVNWKQEF